jgi:tetratricopeptide (TPR) repeat protein
MASLVPGYSYDIFISYRQKDNKHDGWVTEFVNHLKGELESTFKEEISVYFDINPHDGLLETHDVDASLKEKLKCLIFIPIISRTYCDPKSFAWEHEFKAFVEIASKDQFGLKVKLSGGNIASRVLPVQIHDLNTEDRKLVEGELGGYLRGIEFIYKEPGVNRSLLPKDHEEKNLNHTNYRNQINKVALAIKEIIVGLMIKPYEAREETDKPANTIKGVVGEGQKMKLAGPSRLSKQRIIYGVLISTILIIASIFSFTKIFKRDSLDKLRSSGERISVAVFPFQNMTNDTKWDVWQDGIQFNLITALSDYSNKLKVTQTESIGGLLQSKGLDNYAAVTTSVARTISQKLKARIYIYGNISQAASTIRLNAQLIDTKTNEPFKAYQIDGEPEDIITLIDSLSSVLKDFLIISKLKNNVDFSWRQGIATNSPEAYEYLIQGNKAFFNSRDYPAAANLYLKAVAADSNLFLAITMLSWSYYCQDLYDQAKKLCLKVYDKRDQLSMSQRIYADWLYACYFETDYESIKYLKQLVEIDDQNPAVHYDLGNAYRWLYQYNNAIPEFEKSLKIYNEWGSKPNWVYNYTDLGLAYHKIGQFNKEGKLYKKAEKYFSDDPVLIARQATLSLTDKDTAEANLYIAKLRSILKDNAKSDASIATRLGVIYYEAELLDKAEDYFRQALTLDPENVIWLNNLTYFLIENDRKINEGLELAEKALKLSPENYVSLGWKGWGLYKQGKYKEALEILNKSWELKPVYDHDIYLHLEAAKNAVADQKNK